MKSILKSLVPLALLVSLAGCAGPQLKTEWKEKRGYKDSDIDAIMAQYKDYNSMKLRADQQSNALNSAPSIEANNRLRNVFCSCVKKMGDSCRTKEGANIDRTLWVKANAVDMTMVGMSMNFETNSMSKIDPSECPN